MFKIIILKKTLPYQPPHVTLEFPEPAEMLKYLLMSKEDDIRIIKDLL